MYLQLYVNTHSAYHGPVKRRLFRTGNSLTVTIPPAIAAELELRAGDTVELDIDREHDGLLVTRVTQIPSNEGPVTPEFTEWVDGFIDRYGSALRVLKRT